MSDAAVEVPPREGASGADGALGAIYREFHQPLYRFCLAIVGNRQDAEDALQNTMIKVLRALPGEQRSIALKPWLYRIAHNESIDLLRRRRATVPLEAEHSPVGEELAAQVETRERLRQLIGDLGALPERQRETLLMREAAGLSFEEIAAALGTSAAVARQTLYEARLGLRQMDLGREMECVAVTKALSDGDGRVRRRRDIRAHLRGCEECSRFAEEIDSRQTALAAISPLPVAAAAAILNGALGGGSVGAAAGGAAGAAASGGGLLGATAVKSVGTATLLKGAATVAVVAAIGAGVAGRGDLAHLGGGPEATPPARVAPAGKDAEATAAPGRGPAVDAKQDLRSGLRGASQRAVESRRTVDSARVASKPVAAEPEAVRADPVRPPVASAPGRGMGSAGGAGGSAGARPARPSQAGQTPPAASHGQETAAEHRPEGTAPAANSGGQPPAERGKSATAVPEAPPGQPNETGKPPK